MFLSQIPKDKLESLTAAEKTEIVFGGIPDAQSPEETEAADVALLLGSTPETCIERARGAAALYRAGRVKKVIPTGGVIWEYEGRSMSEAHFMAETLIAEGVPEDDIILEDDARTTAENMICGTLTVARRIGLRKMNSLCVVTSVWHMRRSMALAKLYLPRNLRLCSYAVQSPGRGRTDWEANPAAHKKIDNEIACLRSFIETLSIDDIEFKS